MAEQRNRRTVSNNEYKKRSTKRISVVFFPKDLELYEHLKSKNNMGGYIKDLIRKDMNNK